MTQRLTKEDIAKTSGTLNPVGHIVLAFKDDATMQQAVAALRSAGSADADILAYTAAEATPRLRERVRTASGAAGFGYEITLMRRYLAFAEEGAGWLIVYAPDSAAVARITEVATRLHALCAVQYHRLATEELL
ncbi:MAG: hypothetical protein ABIV63_20565 [Caldimonas sp.]